MHYRSVIRVPCVWRDPDPRYRCGRTLWPPCWTFPAPSWCLSVWQGRPWGELYDLRDDPWEMKNLWDNPAQRALKSSLLLKLMHVIQDHGETSPYPLSVS